MRHSFVNKSNEKGLVAFIKMARQDDFGCVAEKSDAVSKLLTIKSCWSAFCLVNRTKLLAS